MCRRQCCPVLDSLGRINLSAVLSKTQQFYRKDGTITMTADVRREDSTQVVCTCQHFRLFMRTAAMSLLLAERIIIDANASEWDRTAAE